MREPGPRSRVKKCLMSRCQKKVMELLRHLKKIEKPSESSGKLWVEHLLMCHRSCPYFPPEGCSHGDLGLVVHWEGNEKSRVFFWKGSARYAQKGSLFSKLIAKA